MRKWLHRIALTALAVLYLHITAATVHGAPAYKMTIRGPGIKNELVIWLAAGEKLLWTMHAGLLTDQRAEPPSPLTPIYEITWFFGACWITTTPCTTDPSEFATHPTRYGFDPQHQQGAISHLKRPAWLPSAYVTTWYRTYPEFDQAMQRILEENGVVVQPTLPATGASPMISRTAWVSVLAGIAALILSLTLRRHRP